MTDRSAPQGAGWSPAGSSDDDGWGPATSVRAGGSRAPRGVVSPPRGSRRSSSAADSDWAPAGPVPRRRSSAGKRSAAASYKSTPSRSAPYPGDAARPKERGLPWWAALLVLIGIAALGGLVDTIGSLVNRTGFNIGIVIASVVAIIVVRRSQMFPVVISPPIIYSAAAVLQLYFRSGGLHDKKVVFDAAANYLVYGFPAIASATALVLIIAGVRLITRR